MSLSHTPRFLRNQNNSNHPLTDPTADNNYNPYVDPDAPLKTLKKINDLGPLSFWYRVERWLEGQPLSTFDNNSN